MASERDGEEFDNENLPRQAIRNAITGGGPADGSFDFNDLQLVEAAGAAAFKNDPVLDDRDAVLADLLSHPFGQLLTSLIDSGESDVGLVASLDMASGLRPRRQASMIGPYLAYAWSPYTKLNPWFTRLSEGKERDAWWARFGFAEAPPFSLVDQRFKDIEKQWRVLAACVRMAIAHAGRSAPWLARVVHGDARAGVSRAELEHCCAAFPGHRCAKPEEEVFASDDVDVVTAARTKANSKLKDDEDDTPHTRRHRDFLRRPSGTPVPYRYFLSSSGCWWRSLDLSAGLRVYGTVRWFGFLVYYLTGAIPGLPLEVVVAPADVQEYDLHVEAFAALEASLGRSTLAVATDSFCSTRPTTTFHLLNRRALVAPRRGGSDRERRGSWATEKWDADGVPRCPNCRGEGVVVGAFISGGRPYLRFECRLQPYPRRGCGGEHTICCLDDPLALLALSRVTEQYWSIRYMRHTFENTHSTQTARHAIAAKHRSGALGRLQSVPAQRLRVWACLLLDWYRTLLRNGWIESEGLVVVRHQTNPIVISGSVDPITHEVLKHGRGTDALLQRLAEREAAGVYRSSGRAWEWFMQDVQQRRASGTATPW